MAEFWRVFGGESKVSNSAKPRITRDALTTLGPKGLMECYCYWVSSIMHSRITRYRAYYGKYIRINTLLSCISPSHYRWPELE